MFSCEECRQSVYPDDPRVRSGRYHLSGCDYCSYYLSPEYRIEKLERKQSMGYTEYTDDLIRKLVLDITNPLRGEMIYVRQSFANTLKEIKEQSDVKQKPF